MALPTRQPRGYSNPDVRTQSLFPNPQNAYDYNGGALHPRSDSFGQKARLSDYPNSAVSESRSPNFSDFNFPFNGSPHSSTAGVVDSNADAAIGPGYYNQRAMSDAASMASSVTFAGQHRASIES